MTKRFLVALALLVLLASCTEKTTNNYYSVEKGGIAGHTNPADPGAVVSVADGAYQTTTDADGYFYLPNLPPGVYRVNVNPPNYSRRSIGNIVVNPGQTVQLKNIILADYPYPIYRTLPTDGAQNVSNYGYYTLYADEQLNLEDLTEGTTIDPPLSGSWEESTSASGLSYRYSSPTRERWAIGATYTVLVDAAVRTAAGVPLGAPVSFSFNTVPLAISLNWPAPGASGGIPLGDFRPQIRFNDEVFADSLSQAVMFTPEIEGIWMTNSRYENQSGGKSQTFWFFPTSGPLQPETSYTLIIDNQPVLTDYARLPEPFIAVFTTEPYGVTAVAPRNGYTYASTATPVLLNFNTNMDPASTNGAFSLVEIGGGALSGSFLWNGPRSMLFQPDEELLSGFAYQVTVSTAARTSEGKNLTKEFISYFVVR